MAKKIRMTFHTEHPSKTGDYTIRDEVSIVDEEGNFDSMSTFAMYAARHMEGFTSFTVSHVEEDQEV